MATDQTRIFVEGEGDRWFARNKAALTAGDPARDLPLRLLQLYNLAPRTALEIGAANGWRLGYLAAQHGTRCVAVEPSTDALRDGQARFPAVRFIQATADDVPLQESFELVVLSFVFCWVGRTRLPRTLAEVDRLVAPGGFLLIFEFLPDAAGLTPYHHLPANAVFTYKQDYAAEFLATGRYRPVALLTGDHETMQLDAQATPENRVGCWLLARTGDPP